MAYVYSASDVKLAYGEYPITGLSSDDSISVEFLAAQNKPVIGIDGGYGTPTRHNYAANLTINLQQGSPANNILSDILYHQRFVSPNGVTQASITLEDPSGSTNILFYSSMVVGEPNQTFSEEVNERTWIFFSPNTVIIENSPTNIVTDTTSDFSAWLQTSDEATLERLKLKST